MGKFSILLIGEDLTHRKLFLGASDFLQNADTLQKAFSISHLAATLNSLQQVTDGCTPEMDGVSVGAEPLHACIKALRENHADSKKMCCAMLQSCDSASLTE